MGQTSRRCPCPGCAPRWGWSARSLSCLPPPLASTSALAGLDPASRTSKRLPRPPTPTTSSLASQKGEKPTHWSVLNIGQPCAVPARQLAAAVKQQVAICSRMQGAGNLRQAVRTCSYLFKVQEEGKRSQPGSRGSVLHLVETLAAEGCTVWQNVRLSRTTSSHDRGTKLTQLL